MDDASISTHMQSVHQEKIWNPLQEFHLNSLNPDEEKMIKEDFIGPYEQLFPPEKVFSMIREFFDQNKPLFTTKSGFKVFHLCLRQKSVQDLEIIFYESFAYIPSLKHRVVCLVLWGIAIPKYLRENGIASGIFQALEKLAKKSRRYLIIQMIMSEIIEEMCIRRGYRPRPPFSMYFDPLVEIERSISERVQTGGLPLSRQKITLTQNETRNNDKMNPEAQRQFQLQIFVGFKNGFEKYFQISKNGTLRARRSDLAAIGNFVQSYSLTIGITSGLVSGHPNFQRTSGYGDIGTSNDNKMKLLEIFSLCFVSYVKICQTLKMPLDKKFKLVTKVEDVLLV